MSLAVGPLANGDRPVSILPSITCSGCGTRIAIAAMGEHICAPDAPISPPPTTRTKSRTFSMSSLKRKMSISGRSPTIVHPPMPQNSPVPQASTTTASKKPTRIPGLNIDSEAANRLAPTQNAVDSAMVSTPISARPESRSTERPTLGRAATTPSPNPFDRRPSSPTYTSNLDCAFPPFPASNPSTSGRSSPSSGRITPSGGDQVPSRSASRLDQVQTLEPESYDWEPKSPGFQAGENVLQKLNSLQSGPFDAVRRQGTGDSKKSTIESETRRPSQQHSTDDTKEESTVTVQSPKDTPAAAGAASNEKKTPPPRPARSSVDMLSPEFLEQFNTEPSSFLAASPIPLEQTSPEVASEEFYDESEAHADERTETNPLKTAKSAPNLKFPKRKESLAVNVLPDFPTPRIELFPPRTASKPGERLDPRLEDAPPVPRPTQETRSYSAHTPSESGSSATSTQNSGSSVASPSSSAASSLGAFSPLNFDEPDFANDEHMHVGGLNVRSPIKPGLRAEMPARPRSPRDSPSRDAPARNSPPRDVSDPYTPLESPMDPELQSSRYEPFEPLDTTTSPLPPQLTLSSPTSTAEPSPALTASPQFSTFGGALSRTPSPLTAGRQASRPRVKKPNCRGCGQMIEGKSVKAADGRLTGRWHKSCFVCRCCQEPFVTADFYVINNEPYCEHHYHEQNGSLCHGCNRGIEGQYLETTSSTRYGLMERKYHPRCFTCCECRQVLVEDYFEIQSRVYCERHALYAMRSQFRRQGPPTTGTALGPVPHAQYDRRDLMAERRTTRLIDPMMA